MKDEPRRRMSLAWTFAFALLGVAAVAQEAAPADEDTTATIARIQAETEKLWGHELGHAIAVDAQSREQLGAKMKDKSSQTAEELADAEESKQLWVALDLMDANTPIDAIASDFYQQQLGGYYDPKDKTLHLIGGFEPKKPGSRSVLAHEITHALQDAKYDLLKLIDGDISSDEKLAHRAIVEGDASHTEHLWNAQANGGTFDPKVFFARWEGSVGGTANLQHFPPFLVQSTLFPYIKGGQFLTPGIRGNYDNARRAAFADPPASTEQILHPMKYWGPKRDVPVKLAFKPLPEGWKENDTDTLGEWSTMQLLTPRLRAPTTVRVTMDVVVSDKEAAEAAAGWGGDNMLFATKGAEFVIAWNTAWDTALDARQFEAALRRRVGLYPAFAKLPPEDRYREAAIDAPANVWKGESRIASFKRTRLGVTFVLATSEEAMAVGVGALGE